MADTEIGVTYSMETDISKLEAPTFTTIERNQQAAMQALDWEHQVNLVGKKVLNPMIHFCDQCLKPILSYGRMIPCKHVFCLECAKQEAKQCPRCKEKVSRVEQAGLGSIFLCTHGGSRYGNTGCRRTYLSKRDLQAHIAHRHIKCKDDDKAVDKKEVNHTEAIRNAVNSLSKASLAAAVAAAASNSSSSPYSSAGNTGPSPYTTSGGGTGPSSYSSGVGTGPSNYSAGSGTGPPVSAYNTAPGGVPGPYRGGGSGPGVVGGGESSNHIAVLNTRQSTLITVPIHGEGSNAPEGVPPPQAHPGYVGGPSGYPAYSPYQTVPPGGHGPPPQTGQVTYNQPPPSYAYPGNYNTGPPIAGNPSGQYSTGPPPSACPPPFNGGPGGPPPGAASGVPHPVAGSSGPGGGSTAPPFQGQWNRPPPGGPGGGSRGVGGPGHPSNYYRR